MPLRSKIKRTIGRIVNRLLLPLRRSRNTPVKPFPMSLIKSELLKSLSIPDVEKYTRISGLHSVLLKDFRKMRYSDLDPDT